MQRPNLGHLEQPKRRETDLFAMRRGCFAKPVMTSRYKGSLGPAVRYFGFAARDCAYAACSG